MPRYADHTDLARNLISYLPELDQIHFQDSEFWETLEVNAGRVIGEASDIGFVKSRLSPAGAGGLQLLCLWAGLNPSQSKADLKNSLAESISINREKSEYQTLLLLNEFLYRKNASAIEGISRLLLPKELSELLCESDLGSQSKRLYYSILIYLQNPHQLQLLMLFERAERAGYTRYALMPEMERAGEALDDESAELARQRIEEDIRVETLEIGVINDALERFEQTHGQRQSLCYDLFHNTEDGVTLIFIMRSLRESHIREVEGIIFGQEAELIVLRLYGGLRSIEEHSRSGVGVQIATTIACEVLEEPNLKYIEDEQLTSHEKFEAFFNTLITEEDDLLRLRELYLEYAPIEEAPQLMIRCEKGKSLAHPIEILQSKGVNLLENLTIMRHLKVTFPVELADETTKLYSFKILFNAVSPDKYFLAYSAANRPTEVCSAFERHLREEYSVYVIPGTQ